MKKLHFLAGVVFLFTSSLLAQEPGDEKWSSSFSTPYGANGDVYCMVEDGGKVYFGGVFSKIGPLTTNNFAIYDKTTNAWSGAGTGVGTVAGCVRTICVVEGGVYVGGRFSHVNGQSGYENVAFFDGSSWHAVDCDFISSYDVYAIVKGDGDDIYIGGDFSSAVNGILCENLVGWNELTGSFGIGRGTNGRVLTLSYYKGYLGHLLVGGRFGYVFDNHGTQYERTNVAVYRFFDNVWTDIQGAWDTEGFGAVSGSAIKADANHPGNYIAYIAGRFNRLKDGSGYVTASNNIAYYKSYDLTCHNLGDGLDYCGEGYYGSVTAIAFDGGNIYAGGSFDCSGSETGYHGFAKWNGSEWIPFGDLSAARILSLSVTGDDIHVAGDFEKVDGYVANNIATWNKVDQVWYSYGGNASGVNGTVLAMARTGTDIFVGGDFSTAGGKRARNIAKYSTTSNIWSVLGSGISRPVRSVAIGGGSDVYCGTQGWPEFPQPYFYSWVMKWNGTSWTQVGGSLKSAFPGSVNSIVFVNANEIFVGGHFISGFNGSTEITLNTIAKWNGSNWVPVGNGLILTVGYPFPEVYCMTYASGSLYVGGQFKRALQETSGYVDVHGLAKWNGTAWSAIGDPLSIDGIIDGRVHSITVSGNTVTVGGLFNRVGTQTNFSNIAQWNGSSWNSLNNGVNNVVYGLSHVGSRVFATGAFTLIGGNSRSRIAYWDMTANQWNQMGSGLNASGYCVLGAYTGGISWKYDVFVGGSFNVSGSSLSSNFARWTDQKQIQEEQKVISNVLPTEFLLSQNNPNPFNPSTTIRYALPSNETVRIAVYNVLGHTVKILVDSYKQAGNHSVVWDARDETGNAVGSGVYICRIVAGDFQSSRKMLLVR